MSRRALFWTERLNRKEVRKLANVTVVGGITIAIASLSSPAASQTVNSPQLGSAELRARLAPTMARPDRPMPADSDDLDGMLQHNDLARLSLRLRGARAAQVINQDLNWEQSRLYNGAGFIVAYAYMYDLWRFGSALPGPDGDGMKDSAAMMFLYNFDLITLDGLKCADVSAPGHRLDQLFIQNQPTFAYIKALPREKRMAIGSISLAIEAATAPVRKNDGVICSGGLAEISAGLKAQGAKPLPQVPNAPGTIGKTYAVPPASDYKPQFVNDAVWQPKQALARQSLPMTLTRMLTLPNDTPPAPAK